MIGPDTPSVPEKKRRKKRGWLAALGVNSLALSILLHVSFGVVATFLIVEHFQKKHINFHATEPPAPQQAEHKVQLAKRNNQESAPPDMKRIVTTDVSAITLPEPPDIPTPDVTTPTPMAGIDGTLGMGNGSGGGGGGGGGGGSPLFGAPDGVGLEGHFYDLKQTPQRSPSGLTWTSYYAILTKFVTTGWHEAMLNAYFKSKTALYAKSFAIALRPSKEAPKAFNVEKEVKPAYWAAYYHGKVSVSEPGDYQFVAYADNVICVRIGGEIVLDGGYSPLLPARDDLHHHIPFEWRKGLNPKTNLKDYVVSQFRTGKIFHMEVGEPVDMSVLLGDDGGTCGFYLMVMKVGGTYESVSDEFSPSDAFLKIPFFQLGDGDPPSFSSKELHPPYSTTPEPWQMAN